MLVRIKGKEYKLDERYVKMSKDIISKTLDNVENFAAENLNRPEKFYLTFLLVMANTGRQTVGSLRADEISSILNS